MTVALCILGYLCAGGFFAGAFVPEDDLYGEIGTFSLIAVFWLPMVFYVAGFFIANCISNAMIEARSRNGGEG